jgi:hypothetical protein
MNDISIERFCAWRYVVLCHGLKDSSSDEVNLWRIIIRSLTSAWFHKGPSDSKDYVNLDWSSWSFSKSLETVKRAFGVLSVSRHALRGAGLPGLPRPNLRLHRFQPSRVIYWSAYIYLLPPEVTGLSAQLPCARPSA